ncbi:MAG TPA: GIY-YIG nuclease family protein, partial [Baekduia sp.]|nr:GIY-YIG nuclease family protein [Baekduia sp.]
VGDRLGFWEQELRSSPGFVYFIQQGDTGPVKIGRAKHPTKRIRDLQTGNPDELLLREVIPGGAALERNLHHRFEPARLRGGPGTDFPVI